MQEVDEEENVQSGVLVQLRRVSRAPGCYWEEYRRWIRLTFGMLAQSSQTIARLPRPELISDEEYISNAAARGEHWTPLCSCWVR